MENSEVDLHIYRQLFFDEDAKAIQWKKDWLSKWHWDN